MVHDVRACQLQSDGLLAKGSIWAGYDTTVAHHDAVVAWTRPAVYARGSLLRVLLDGDCGVLQCDAMLRTLFRTPTATMALE